MMFQTDEKLVRPDWIWIGMWVFGVLMFSAGVGLGRTLVEQEEPSVQTVPFATLEDMRFLVGKMRVCEETLSAYDIHVDPTKYE
mgnify:CR=1 FL=1|tara:strand:- start:3449 stop:3700 length:252 start_codon:yes stop_codon:yes gene_type:complete